MLHQGAKNYWLNYRIRKNLNQLVEVANQCGVTMQELSATLKLLSAKTIKPLSKSLKSTRMSIRA